MQRVQHQTRREGGITVGDTRYELDSEGVVEVSDEHAAKLLQGAKWKLEGEWKEWQRKVVDTAPPIVAGARRARTRAELLGLADAEGVAGAAEALEKEHEPPAVASEPDPEEDEEEEVVVSMDRTKAELVDIAEQLGLDVRGKTKLQIIEAIEASQE